MTDRQAAGFGTASPHVRSDSAGETLQGRHKCVSSGEGMLFSIQIIYKKSSCSQQLPFRVPSTSLYHSPTTLSHGSDVFLVVFNSNLLPLLLKILLYLCVSLWE